MSFWLAVAIAAGSSLAGTALGALLAAFTRPGKKRMGLLFEAAGGIMLGVVCFDLLPGALGDAGIYPGLLSILAGVLTLFIASALLEQYARSLSRGRLRGLTIAAGLALHNLPEGLAMGSSLTLGVSGLALCAVVALHDIPEGLALALPLKADGVKTSRAVSLAVLSGLPTLLGAWGGRALGGMDTGLIALTMGYAGGAMLYVVCKQMLTEREDYNGWGLLLGVLTGVLLSSAI